MKKCKFWKHCTLYRENSNPCNKTGGDAYGIDRTGGCYRDLEEKGNGSQYWKGKCGKGMQVVDVIDYVVCFMVVLGFLLLWFLLFLCFGILYALWVVICVPVAAIFYLPSLGQSWGLSMKVKEWIYSGWLGEGNLLDKAKDE